jgi:hypothetical protein
MRTGGSAAAWIASIIAAVALIAIVAFTMMVAAIIWVPLLLAVVATMIAVWLRASKAPQPPR